MASCVLYIHIYIIFFFLSGTQEKCLFSSLVKRNTLLKCFSMTCSEVHVVSCTSVLSKKVFEICPETFFQIWTHTQAWPPHPPSSPPPAVSSNQSHGEYPDCRSERESGGEASLLVSPLVVAGIVIGLVLFLSCLTIIVGSLRKDSRLRNPHLYGQSDNKQSHYKSSEVTERSSGRSIYSK